MFHPPSLPYRNLVYIKFNSFIDGKKVHLKKCYSEFNDGPFHPFQIGLIYKIYSGAVFIATRLGTLIVHEVLDENGKNIIPKHRDSEDIFGQNPTIAVLSIGTPRIIRFTPVNPTIKSVKAISNDTIDIILEHGSLLIMSGTMQKYYCHEILSDDNITDSRYSLTFREHIL